MTGAIQQCLEAVGGAPATLHDHDYLLTWERSGEELRATLAVARLLEALHREGRDARMFRSGLAVSLFRDNSTRTRFAYASAANLLGLAVSDLDEKQSQIAHGETVRETANMISFCAQAVGIRDDMYLGEGHRYMVEVAEALDEGHKEGVLANRPAVINLQCDLDHPTQSLSDLSHLVATYGSLEALRGKRLAMSWAYSPSYGKPLSVPQGIIGLLTRFGMDIVLAHPPGYDLHPEVVGMAHEQAEASGGAFAVTDSMADAFRDADVVYPKSWAPYHNMEQRTELLRGGRRDELAELEKTCLKENARYLDWECTDGLMELTRGGEALYMHCLPADITGVSCERGEVSADVFERYRLRTYREAAYKPYVIAAMILLCRSDDPVGTCRRLVETS